MKDNRGNVKTSNFALCTIINIILLFIILLLIARTVLLPQSLVYDAHLSQTAEMKRLISETTQLLKDLSAANVQLPDSVQTDIMHIQHDFPKDGSTAEQIRQFLISRGITGGATGGETNRLLLQKLQSDLQNCSSSAQETSAALHQCHVENQNINQHIVAAKTGAGNRGSKGCASEEQSQKWLVIGIPTVSRPNDEDYLLQTLAAMASQFPDNPQDLFYEKILVVIVNVQSHEIDSKPHIRFNEARQTYSAESGHSKAGYFRFIEAPQSELSLSLDLKKESFGKKDLGSANVPGRMVRKQTRDLALVISKSVGIGKYYLFLEDDMKFCPHGLSSIQYLLNKASSYHPDWLAIRASYGMNGIFMHDKDLLTFAEYLRKNQVRRPPDHLVVEWYAGETPDSKLYKAGRANIGFRYNLFDHLGVSSSLRSQKQSSFPRCYEKLAVPTVFEVEAFNPKLCPNDDVWPCAHVTPSQQSHLDWSSLVRRHY